VKVITVYASIPRLVVLGQPLHNLFRREASKPTTRAYRLHVPSLQALHKLIELGAGNLVIGVLNGSTRATARLSSLRRCTVVRAATAALALARYGRCRGLSALELISRRGGGDGVAFSYRI